MLLALARRRTRCYVEIVRRIVPTIVAICVAFGLALGARPVDDRPRDPHATQLVVHRAAVAMASRRHADPGTGLTPFVAPPLVSLVPAPIARAWSVTIACAAPGDAPRPACSARGPPVA